MKKIAAGYYIGNYKNIEFEIHKINEHKIHWYWTINNKPANDWYNSKKDSIIAAKDYIDNVT